MFDLKRPCNNCPFVRGNGELFGLHPERILEIVNGPAFQCHKTVDYTHHDDPILRQGQSPQQCAGLMSLLRKIGRPNQIMRVAEYFGVNLNHLYDGNTYDNLQEVLDAHTGNEAMRSKSGLREPL
jgi:hypothetical protein